MELSVTAEMILFIAGVWKRTGVKVSLDFFLIFILIYYLVKSEAKMHSASMVKNTIYRDKNNN